jgi:hypothetical protein
MTKEDRFAIVKELDLLAIKYKNDFPEYSKLLSALVCTFAWNNEQQLIDYLCPYMDDLGKKRDMSLPPYFVRSSVNFDLERN